MDLTKDPKPQENLKVGRPYGNTKSVMCGKAEQQRSGDARKGKAFPQIDGRSPSTDFGVMKRFEIVRRLEYRKIDFGDVFDGFDVRFRGVGKQVRALI